MSLDKLNICTLENDGKLLTYSLTYSKCSWKKKALCSNLSQICLCPFRLLQLVTLFYLFLQTGSDILGRNWINKPKNLRRSYNQVSLVVGERFKLLFWFSKSNHQFQTVLGYSDALSYFKCSQWWCWHHHVNIITV